MGSLLEPCWECTQLAYTIELLSIIPGAQNGDKFLSLLESFYLASFRTQPCACFALWLVPVLCYCCGNIHDILELEA